MDYVIHQAAIPSVPRSVDNPEESHRANVDAMLQMLLASRDAGVKRAGLRRIVVRLRRHRGAAEDRDDADQSAVAVRAAEADGRDVRADVHAPLRPRDGDDALLQRVRAAAGSGLAVLGRDLAVHQGAAATGRGR